MIHRRFFDCDGFAPFARCDFILLTQIYFSLVKPLSLASMNASLDEISIQFVTFMFNSTSRDCNFSHSQLCQTALFHFSLTLVTQLRYYLYKSVLLLSSSTLLFRYERINFLSITSNDSFLVYFVFYNYGFASFHVQYFISLSFDFLLLSTHCFQNIDFASFLVHIKGVFSCVSRNKDAFEGAQMLISET